MPAFIVPLVAMAISAASAAYAQNKAKKAQDKSNAFNELRISQADDWYNQNYYKNYLESDIARGTLEKLSKRFREQNDANASNSAAGGGTPEEVLASSKVAQNQLNDATLSLAAQGQQWKDTISQRYQNMLVPLYNNQQSILQNQVGMYDNLTKAGSSAGAGLMNAWAYGSFDKANNTTDTPEDTYSKGMDYLNPYLSKKHQ